MAPPTQGRMTKPARSLEHRPSLSKYNVVVVEVLSGIQNCKDVVLVLGVARRSAITAAIRFVARVWDFALRFVCMPTGIKPKTAIKQKAAIPKANVTSTSENADAKCPFIGGKFLRHRQTRLPLSQRYSLSLD